jgi:hypothetical protein
MLLRQNLDQSRKRLLGPLTSITAESAASKNIFNRALIAAVILSLNSCSRLGI